MKSTMQRLPDGSIELLITIPWAEVEAQYEKTVEHMVEHAEVDGFRKGKAPRNVVEAKLDKTKVYEEALKDIIPNSYGKAVE
jgi:trigger factor